MTPSIESCTARELEVLGLDSCTSFGGQSRCVQRHDICKFVLPLAVSPQQYARRVCAFKNPGLIDSSAYLQHVVIGEVVYHFSSVASLDALAQNAFLLTQSECSEREEEDPHEISTNGSRSPRCRSVTHRVKLIQ